MSDYSAPILDSILAKVGGTPLVRMDRIAAEEGLACNLLAKCEFFNAGGSVKDRIAKRMVEQAEKDGRLVPGKSVVIEPTSGNTGVGLALQCAVKGYRCIIVMPEKMSMEKQNALAALGAEIVRTPTEAPWDAPESHISVARRLERRIEGGVILDQYGNENNPLAHYYGTGTEIVDAVAQDALPDAAKPIPAHLSAAAPAGVAAPLTPPQTPPPRRPTTGLVDVLVAGAGTGGTITGIARRVKESNPGAVVVGVDPFGSVLARPEALNALPDGCGAAYGVEGIGYDFVPAALDLGCVDEWLKSTDAASFAATRRLLRAEGLLCGGSSGAALDGALRWLRSPEGWERAGGVRGKNVVVVLPDSVRNYITKPWLLEGARDEERQKELMRLAAV